jgi:hypothetical protein
VDEADAAESLLDPVEVGVIAALIFFFIRKKKRSQGGFQLENEKTFGGEVSFSS